jgi:hypothetical protein
MMRVPGCQGCSRSLPLGYESVWHRKSQTSAAKSLIDLLAFVARLKAVP